MQEAAKVEVGKIIENNKFGPFKIIDNLGVIDHVHYVNIEFINLNMYGFHTKRTVRLCAVTIDNPKVTDCYQPKFYGVACNGNMYRKCYNETKEYELWMNMIKRCYNTKAQNYPYYGGRGVTVDLRWRCYEYFYNDLPLIQGYDLWKNNPYDYQIDKDILQPDIPDNMKVYSLNTCIFVSKLQNALDMNIRKNINKSGYIGVKINDINKYSVEICKEYFGTFDDIIAAANEYNYIATAKGYSPEYLNKVPYMSHIEVLQHKIEPVRKNGYYEVIKIIK